MARDFLIVALVVTWAAAGLHTAKPANAQERAGTISGRIVQAGEAEPTLFEGAIMVVPADTPQPIPYEDALGLFLEHNYTGVFEATGLPDGEYLVGFEVNPDWVPALGEEIVFEAPTASGMRNASFPAVRVRISGGRAVAPGIPVAGASPETGELKITLLMPEEPAVEPITSLASLPRGSGSISGRVYLDMEGCEGCQGQQAVVVVPADLDRRLDLGDTIDLGYYMRTDNEGFYIVTDIADGEYLVAPVVRGAEFKGAFSEWVEEARADGTVGRYPAIRVTIADGEAVTGVGFAMPGPEPVPAPAADAAGDGDGWLGTALAYAGAGVAGVIMLMLGFGVVRRLATRRGVE